MPMNQRLMRPSPHHPEALAWQAAATANGGVVSPGTLEAVSDFCRAIDAAGLRGEFLRLNLCCGSNLSAALTPLYRGASPSGTQFGLAADTNEGPISSLSYSQATGIPFNGSNQYCKTGLTLTNLYDFGGRIHNSHLSVYVRATAIGPHIGCYDYAPLYNAQSIALDAGSTPVIADGSPMYRVGAVNYGEGELFANAGGLGLHLAYKTSSTAGKYWINNSDATGSAVGGDYEFTGGATAGAVTISNGSITGIAVASGGTNHSFFAPPVVQIIGGGGSGAQATSTVSGTAVSAITVTNGGSGYTSAPTVRLISDPFPIYVGAASFSYDSGNGPELLYLVSESTLAAYSIGTRGNISSTAGRAAFYNAMQAFQKALGRSVV